MMWNRILKHVGEVAENSAVSFTFEYYGDKRITTVQGSCSCQSVRINGNKVEVLMNVGGVMNEDGYKRKNVTVTVVFHDNSKQLLYLESIVVKNGTD